MIICAITFHYWSKHILKMNSCLLIDPKKLYVLAIAQLEKKVVV